MTNQPQNVQKVDVQQLDILKPPSKVMRFTQRIREFKLNFWSGSLAAKETVTTVEPTDARY